MPADPRMLEMLSYYRDAELHGASLLLRLLKMTRDLPDVQVKLTLHVAQETRHAWLWTERIRELDGWPVDVSGYQARIGIDTIIGGVTPDLRLEEATALGTDTVLADQPPRSGRVGHGLRVGGSL